MQYQLLANKTLTTTTKRLVTKPSIKLPGLALAFIGTKGDLKREEQAGCTWRNTNYKHMTSKQLYLQWLTHASTTRTRTQI